MNTIGTKLPPNSNSRYYNTKIETLNSLKERIFLGGGEKAIAKQHSKKKMTARERIAKLVDARESFWEINIFAAHGMYEEFGGAPSAGVVTGIAKVSGKDVILVANDATVKAGAWFPMTTKKILRAQEIAMENRIPIIYLVDSAGVFLPLQEEIFPDKEHFGRVFRNNAQISAMGIPQISAIMGPCVAGGAYLPIMSDEALIVDGEGSLFLAGSHLVKAAIGEEVDNETLGGGKVHSSLSGVTDYLMKNDEECILKIRELVSYFPDNSVSNLNRSEAHSPKFDPKELNSLLPEEPLKPYDMYEIIARIVDDSKIDEYKAEYGKTLITAYARIEGWAVGIVANQRKIVKNGNGEMQIGGVIYSDSADKAARFIMNCNQRNIPLLFLQDVTGFMVGTKAEHGGIIKDGAKMVNAVANSVVPKVTIIVGNSFGAGNYAMCGKSYDPRFIFSYPNAKIAVMGGDQASNVLLDIKLRNRKNNIAAEKREKILSQIKNSYNEKSTPLYAASRLWIDEIISPDETRSHISRALSLAAHSKNPNKFNVGVIQT